jgi:hypothetical protein
VNVQPTLSNVHQTQLKDPKRQPLLLGSPAVQCLLHRRSHIPELSFHLRPPQEVAGILQRVDRVGRWVVLAGDIFGGLHADPLVMCEALHGHCAPARLVPIAVVKVPNL